MPCKTQRCGCSSSSNSSSSSSGGHVPISAPAKEAKNASTCTLSRLKWNLMMTMINLICFSPFV